MKNLYVRIVSAILVLCMMFLTACSTVEPAVNGGADNTTPTPEVNVPLPGVEQSKPTVDESITPAGDIDEEPLSTESEIKDADGNLLVPFDVAYPDEFNVGNHKYREDVLLLKMKEDFDGKLSDALKACGFASIEESVVTAKGTWYEAKLSDDADIVETIRLARALDDVVMADYDYIIETAAVAAPESSGELDLGEVHEKVIGNGQLKNQWFLNYSGIQQAWKELEKAGIEPGGSPSVVVAVIDTGVDYTHPDLVSNMWVNSGEIPDNGRDDDGNGYVDDYYGYDAVAQKGSGMDDHGHGTHVAGIIAAANNKEGVVGVAYNAKIMTVKAGQATGIFTQNAIAKAIIYAYEMGADVINMSFGGSACSIAVQDALQTAYTRSSLVAAAGNDGMPNQPTDYYPVPLPHYPAALSYVIGVMSVDRSGIESGFTNWDVYAYNSIEYEVYAPGEGIYSTLAGGNYGNLSGTSMAAPIVSGMAALLRSYFSDRDMYPSKFIQAQICATSGDTATCVDPKMHTVGGSLHNLPMIANVHDALTKLPQPDVNLYDYYIFDSKSISDANNGDGVVDAGETVDIAIVLRNRWGMSKNTIVTIDSLSSGGLANPYVEILIGTENYDGVGTYSTKSMLVYNDENIITGYVQPLRVKISKDCPNDYVIGLNVTTSFANALDEKDKNAYSNYATYGISFDVRSGVILPSQINEDMTLTKDNLYIIPNSTYIAEGVTVKVEPGTRIQFWSDDPADPYADTYIAYLNVAGSFICEGTEDEPVELFPSDLMSNYRVEIKDSGTVRLSYTTVTNPYIVADSIDHCTFRYNYARTLYYRYLSDGRVSAGNTYGLVSCSRVTNSLFYKCFYLCFGVYSSDPVVNFDTCAFVDSYCRFNFHHYPEISCNFNNCVFMGNTAKDESGYTYPSSLTLYNTLSAGVNKVVRDPNTGTTYIAVNYSNDGSVAALNAVRKIAQQLGGDIVCCETEAEWNFIRSKFGSYYSCGIGIESSDATTWVNGEPIGDFMPTPGTGSKTATTYYSNNSLHFSTAPTYYLLELPGSIYVDNIYLRETEVKIDDKSTYQIFASTIPATFDTTKLLYVSEDENIATVSETGLVTPVGEGKTRILVYSPDYKVYAALTIEVVDKVPVVDVTFGDHVIELGNTAEIIPTYAPQNTTERGVSYVSNDPDIVTVNAYGVITAVGTGTATITATAQNGTTDIITVKVISKVESVSFTDHFYVTYLGDTDEGWKPAISPANATDYTIKYDSSNPEVAYVDADGKLVRVGAGITTLRAEVVGTTLYAELQISVSETAFEQSRVVCMDYYSSSILAVTDDGSLWLWGICPYSSTYVLRVPTKIADGVRSAVFGRFDNYSNAYSGYTLYISYVDLDGELCELGYNWQSGSVTQESTFEISNLKAVYEYGSSFYALTEDGLVYVVGYNNYGQLGVGTTANISSLAFMGITDVKDIFAYDSSVGILRENGELYIAGTTNNKYSTPSLIDTDVIDIRGGSSYMIYEKADGIQYCFCYNNSTKPVELKSSYGKFYGNGYYTTSGSSSGSYTTFKDGRVYYKGSLVEGVEDPVDLIYLNGSYFVLTADGSIYGFGNNDHYELADLTNVDRYYEAEKIFFGIGSDEVVPAIEKDNLTDGVLKEDSLILDYNRAIRSGSGYPNITLKDSRGMTIYITKDIRLDKLTITTLDPLTDGETYTLTIPSSSFITAWGKGSTSYTLTFTYHNDTAIELWSSDLTDGATLSDGVLSGEIEYSFAIAGDAFDDIALSLNGDAVSGLQVALSDGVLSLSAKDLVPGEYKLTIPAGALKDNVGGVSDELVYTFTVPAPEEVEYIPLETLYSSLGSMTEGVALLPVWRVTMNKGFALDESLVTLLDSEGNAIELDLSIEKNTLVITPTSALTELTTYRLTVAEGAMTDEVGATVDTISVEFETVDILDRFFWTTDAFLEIYRAAVYDNAWNYQFYNNAVLNNFNITNVEKWLRITAASGGINDKIGLGQNWWGTTNEDIIGKQIIDFDDFQSLKDIIYAPYLTEAPENTFPFVTAAYLLNSDGERVNRVSNETVTFVIEFNRDMDVTVPLRVRFGSSEPYAEYEISGEYVNARRWEGTYTLKTTIENGRQFINIENGRAADDHYLTLWETDSCRFGFEIDTTGAQAMMMQATATATGIELSWVQDDFDTLAGYNVYRSTKEDGLYTRLNDYVLPADVNTFFDDTVEPGVRYYYNFTVVKTDFSESDPSGKINLMSLDTMAPNIYHSPTRTAYTGSNLIITATITDNLAIKEARLYYRTVGETEYKSVAMTPFNSRYSAVIGSEHIDIAGLEYYIVAFDGISETLKGGADDPYLVTVKLAVDANSLGDVDGDGVITNRDALMLLQAANDLLNLSEEQFLRADINGDGELSAVEALRILQYVSGKVTTIVD